jgi:hypothetical protein
MIIKGNTIIADEGKKLRHIEDGVVVGAEWSLGYIYYRDGVKLDEPYLEKISDYDEVSGDEYFEENRDKYVELIVGFIREKYTVDDEIAINRQRDTKPEAFQEYFDYCEECKRKSREIVMEMYDNA